MQGEDKIREFMARVVPWPGVDPVTPGWVNIHWRSALKSDAARLIWGGKPVKNINDFMWWANWTLANQNIKDVFFCTSLQAEISRNSKGSSKVVRSKELALSLKAIWLDVDVKEPPKGYATLEDALVAVNKFLIDTTLPPPTALIATGGGLHVYWISNKELIPNEWQPYAEGLKSLAIKHGLLCDAGVTTDAARILRVPGTFNHKQLPLRPVRVLGLRDTDYDFRASLSKFCVATPTIQLKSKMLGAPAAGFAILPKETLSVGLDLQEMPPLDWVPIAQGCAFIGDALKTEGKEYSQPMWNLTTLAATFMENGHALAHKMGKGHPGYSAESTDAMWERKNRERKDRGLGWPSCAAIQASGCAACAVCPHFNKGKSPLNLSAPIQTVAPQGQIALEASHGDEATFPAGYTINKDGYVCKLEETKDGEVFPIQLFFNKITNGWVEEGHHSLHFTVTTSKGRTQDVSIKAANLINGTEMWSILQEQGVLPIPKQRANAEGFLMSWKAKLQEAKEALKSQPFGWWYGDDGVRHGFVHGGVLMKDDGTDNPAGTGDRRIRGWYEPKGTIEPWLRACKLITDQKRPELDVILAAAFAAPLIVTAAKKSCFLSAYGDSGAGKSSAVSVGLAVWGHPLLTKDSKLSTTRSVVEKMGQVANLPIYWDEITDIDTQTKIFETLFTASEGVSPGRLNSRAETKDRSSWKLLVTICSNLSFVQYLVRKQKETDAGIYRVFEYETTEPPSLTSPGRLKSTTDADRILQELEQNYGVVGMKYAKMLGSDPAAIDAYTLSVMKNFEQAIGDVPMPERYWISICGVLLAGARLANEILHTNLDIPAMKAFLIAQYFENRKRRAMEARQGGTVRHTEELLTGFLRDNIGRTVWTDTFPRGKGRPKKVKLYYGPKLDSGKGIYIQWALEDKLLRFSKMKFGEFLARNEVGGGSVFRGLEKHFGAQTQYAMLAANTSYVVNQETLICIPVPEDTPLWELMHAYTKITGETLEPVAAVGDACEAVG